MLKYSNIRYEELRKDFGYKQRDVANLLGVPRNTYSKWENFINDMSLDYCNNLANIYNCSLDYLLGITDKYIKITQKLPINYTLLSKRLFQLRKESKLTQRQLSDKLGFPVNTYSQYERGLRIPTVLKLLVIVNYYDSSFDYITGKI